MTMANQLEALTAQYEEEAQTLQSALVNQIRSLPDNPRLTRLSDRPAAFTMMSSDFLASGNWTVEHHDFKRQHEVIADAVDQAAPAEAVRRLRRIVADGHIAAKTPNVRQRNIKLHPDVIRQLEHVLGEGVRHDEG